MSFIQRLEKQITSVVFGAVNKAISKYLASFGVLHSVIGNLEIFYNFLTPDILNDSRDRQTH